MGGTDVLRAEFDRELREVATAREWLRTHLPDLPPDVSRDAQLVLSELVTNAIEHGTGDPVVVSADRRPDAVVLTVESVGPAPSVGAVDSWRVAEAHEVTGRGLGIVRAVADSVDVMKTADRLVVTARLDV